MSSFEERLRQIRLSSGLSQNKFAEKIGESQGNYNRYERGRVFPTYPFLFKLIEELNVDINWLLTGDGEMFRPATRVANIIPLGEQAAGRRPGQSNSAGTVSEPGQIYNTVQREGEEGLTEVLNAFTGAIKQIEQRLIELERQVETLKKSRK